jgi:hypothetical protein
MPKLIHTHTRIVDEDNPRITFIGDGWGDLEVVKGLNLIARPKDGVQ